MRKALRVTITAPLAARVAFLQRDYRHLIENNDDLMKLLSGLRRRYSKEVFDGTKILKTKLGWICNWHTENAL